MFKSKQFTCCAKERGFGVFEVMVALVLFSMVGLSLAQSAILSMRYQKQAEIGNFAKNFAVSKAELLSGTSFNLLDNTFDSTESALAVAGHDITFSRVTDVTVNADGSKTIAISVTSSSPLLPKAISYTTRLAPAES